MKKHASIKLFNTRKYFATGLLGFVFIIYIISLIYESNYHWLAYTKAFSEAAMIGGLADWFAVTAIFRKPFGLPIPHTALIKNNQSKIATELGRFIKNNFLNSRLIAKTVLNANPINQLLSKLKHESIAIPIMDLIAKILSNLINQTKPQQIHKILNEILNQYTGRNIGHNLSTLISILKEHNAQDIIFDGLAHELHTMLTNEETRNILERNLNEWVEKNQQNHSGAWDKIKKSFHGVLVGQLDGWISEKMIDWAESYLNTVIHDSQHTLRKSFDSYINKIQDNLNNSDDWHHKLEEYKQKMSDSSTIDQKIKAYLNNFQIWFANDIQQNDSKFRLYLNQIYHQIISKIDNNPKAKNSINQYFINFIRMIVIKNKQQVSQFIAYQVNNWDSDVMVNKLEASVGKDLQFIRINGTIIGGFIGLFIYLINKAIL